MNYICQLFIKFPNKNYFLYILCSIDISLNLTALWNTVKILLFLVHATTILSIAIIFHVKEINFQFLNIQKCKPDIKSINLKLTFIYQEISIVAKIITKSDNCLVSNLFLAAYLSQMPLNINLISILTFRNLLINEKTFFVIAASLQISIPFIAAQALIAMIDTYYKLHANLYKIQLLKIEDLNSSVFIKTKLKLMTNYEINCTKNKLYFRIGSLGSMSREGFVEVKYANYLNFKINEIFYIKQFILAYSGYILYSFKLIYKNYNDYV